MNVLLSVTDYDKGSKLQKPRVGGESVDREIPSLLITAIFATPSIVFVITEIQAIAFTCKIIEQLEQVFIID